MAYNYQDPYAALGLTRSEIEEMAEAEGAKKIKKAYTDKVLKAHPDRGGDPEEFKYCTDAYEILCNPSVRGNPFRGWTSRSEHSGKSTGGTSRSYNYQLALKETLGFKFNIFLREWQKSKDMDVNYAVSFKKN
jgi:curved DNA-binding protein CbpA